MSEVIASKQPIPVGRGGMTAAIKAAESGKQVILVEKKRSIGGCVSQLYKYFPKLYMLSCGREINQRRLKANRNLRLLTLTEASGECKKAVETIVTRLAGITLLVTGCVGSAHGAFVSPTAPDGFMIQPYFEVDRGVGRITFSPTGDLYAGVAINSGQSRVLRVVKDAVTGTVSVSDFGPSMTRPAVPQFDAAGSVAPQPNSVLVLSDPPGDSSGVTLWAIGPDGSAEQLLTAAVSEMTRATDMLFDKHGRLLLTGGLGSIYAVQRNGQSYELAKAYSQSGVGFSFGAAVNNGAAEIVTAWQFGDPRIRVLSETGDLIGTLGESISDPASMTFSPVGALWNGDLFVTEPVSGTVFRVDNETGIATAFATGFNFPIDLAFGPDGALYVSDIFDPPGGERLGAVFRISAVPLPSTFWLLMSSLLCLGVIGVVNGCGTRSYLWVRAVPRVGQLISLRPLESTI